MLALILEADRANKKKLTRQEVIELIEEEKSITLKPTFVTNLRKDEARIMAVHSEYDASLKRKTTDRLAPLNNRLMEWYEKMENEKAIITDAALIAKAKRIAETEQLVLPKNFHFSMDCLLRFKRRNGIGLQEMHGEAGDADAVGINLCRAHLPDILKSFSTEDIYNLDETALFYRQLPSRSLMRSARKGGKLAKKRCTVNVIVNAKGTDTHLQVIGESKRPRCFPKTFKAWDTFHIDYYHNETSWMRTDIFVDVVIKFANRIRRKNKKCVVNNG